MNDLIIVGAGPAGLTAALYATRAGVKTLILERGAPGGKVFTTHKVENYPGFESISGRELSQIFHKQSLLFGAQYEYGDVTDIKKENDKFKVTTNINEYEAKKVIIATGTENKLLGAKGEEEYTGKGVSYCAVCDGNFFKDQDVVVVGGGNSALEESLYLADICKTVTIIHRRQELRAEEYIVQKVKEKENINFKFDSEVVEFRGEPTLSEVEIKTKNKENEIIKAKGAFIYVGLKPMTQKFQNFDIFTDNKNIIVNKNMETNISGLYSAGDVTDKKLRQIATAINDGAIAAQSVIDSLK